MQRIENAREALHNKRYKEVLVELLYQLADDDFILSFRGSEWLGLAPHIEEDVAFSSISQNTMGHAYIYYQLLSDLGEGNVDDLAHGRPPGVRKNAVLLEEENGTGTYLDEPRFDWAFTVVRNYFYEVYKKMKLELLKQSSYVPLQHAAENILKEQYYHLMHWDTWFRQLVQAGGEARERMEKAIERVWDEFGGVLSYGPLGEEMVDFGLIEKEDVLRKKWLTFMEELFHSLGMKKFDEPKMKKGNGRAGEHIEDLTKALQTLSEVYNVNPSAQW